MKEVIDPAEWRLYQKMYITADGRVLDTGNGNISHSEGQGFAMLLAVGYEDREQFERLWTWTKANLQVRRDKLFAWKWVPSDSGGAVGDTNNASDGDLAIAWALYRASLKWKQPEWREEARAVCREVRRKLLRPSAHGLMLLPGEYGFESSKGLTVNLSYWIFPAFKAFNRLDPSPSWQELIDSGTDLLAKARFGRWQLPPDWLLVEEGLRPADGFKPQFGYNAVRVPLYLIWAGFDDEQNLQPFHQFWSFFARAPFLPAWTDLSCDSVNSFDASNGIKGIAELTRAAVQGRSRPALPTLDDQQDYYSASLLLLAKLASLESQQR